MTRFHRNAYALVLLFLMSGVVLGAFGAHALKERLSDAALNSFDTAVRYQITMALGAGFVLLLSERIQLKGFQLAFSCIAVGIVLFSGSIYALTALPAGSALRAVLGPITPLGGVSFVIGYGIALFSLVRGPKKSK